MTKDVRLKIDKVKKVFRGFPFDYEEGLSHFHSFLLDLENSCFISFSELVVELDHF